MKSLKPVKLSLKHRILKKLGVFSVEEEIRKCLANVTAEDYPLEPIVRKTTLAMLLGNKYNPKCINSMYQEDNVNSYFHKEYRTKGYLKFERHYKAARFIVEDLVEKLHAHIQDKELAVHYDLGETRSREYLLDIDMLKTLCYIVDRDSETSGTEELGNYLTVIGNEVDTFISTYSQMLATDVKEFGFSKFSISQPQK